MTANTSESRARHRAHCLRSAAPCFTRALAAALATTALLAANAALAAVDLRVQARPITDPIEAYVTVTDGSGNPVSGLSASDFTVNLDGVAVPLTPADISLPPSQNADQKISIMFVMDYSGSVDATAEGVMEAAIIDLVSSMSPGDYAGVVKFNVSLGATLRYPLGDVSENLALLIDSIDEPYAGNGTNLLDGIALAVAQFESTPGLPAGPKAVIVITDGGENSSSTDKYELIADANAAGIALFTIAVGNYATQDKDGLLSFLPVETGGQLIEAPTTTAIQQAYSVIAAMLDNEYLITLPASLVEDCEEHTLAVRVSAAAGGGRMAARFSRCSPQAPAPAGGGGSGGGGGGALGLAELAIALAALLSGRRRRTTASGTRVTGRRTPA